MNKLKFSFKIKELELQVEGTKEDVSSITNNIGQQFKGLIQPPGFTSQDTSTQSLAITEDGEITEVKSSRKKRRNSHGQPKGEKGKAYDFKNDPTKYGSPIQGWTCLEKSVWLLYVVNNEIKVSEMTAGEIAETFNKHFKQQGTIRASNMSRDLGKQKAGAKAIVGENTTVFPAKWFLTEEGSKLAQKLIQDLRIAKS